MTTIAIVYHSGYGHTKVTAEHVLKGVQAVAGVQASLHTVSEFHAPTNRVYGPEWDVLNKADGLLFGAPTYMGDVSAKMKEFMEHTGGLWYAQAWKHKIAGGFTNSGGLSGDKLHSLHSLFTFAAQHSMLWAPTGLMVGGIDAANAASINRLSSFSGLMTQADQGSPDVTPGPADRATAEAYGNHFAQLTVRWARGAR